MTAIEGVFTHDHNALAVAEQEYDAAKEHFSQVLKYRNVLNPDYQRRLNDAQERLEIARERYLTLLISG